MRRSLRDTQRRFWSKVVQDEKTGCAAWVGALDPAGYGVFGVRTDDMPVQRFRKAHQWTYEWARGPVPPGLEVRQTCRNVACVNPEHLELVTHRESLLRSPNTLAAIRSAQTHCIHGHEFTPENTRPLRRNSARPGRACRTCDRRRSAQRLARKYAVHTPYERSA